MNWTGVAIFATYPPGVPFGQDGKLRVLSGEFELTVVLEREGEWTGKPLIGVTYQACTEDACLAPRTVELDVAIDPLVEAALAVGGFAPASAAAGSFTG